MNKLNLVEALKNKAGLTRTEAAAVANLFFDQMSETLASGDRVEIRGLCSFFVKTYKSYTGRNPRSDKKVKVVPKKLPSFKPGKELRGRVDWP